MLIEQGVPVFERLRVSPACPLILASHVALDRAREKAQGANAIGTTGRGIGPAYEDKVARRAVRVSDLFHRERFAAKLGEILDYHNFVLQRYFQTAPVDFQQVLESNLELGERLKPLVADVTGILEQLSVEGRNVLFEGAQGAMLDVDLGTYPYRHLLDHHAPAARRPAPASVRGAFTRCSASSRPTPPASARGPFPTELFDEYGEHLSRVGHEFGSVTGRQRRCGWFDAVALRRSIVHNSCSSLCVTKLDVLDGLDTIRVCVGYKIDGAAHPHPAAAVRAFRRLRGRLRGAARLEGKHASASPATRSCPRMPAATSSGCKPWSACRSHRLHRSGSRPDHRPTAPVRLAGAARCVPRRDNRVGWRRSRTWRQSRDSQRSR